MLPKQDHLCVMRFHAITMPKREVTAGKWVNKAAISGFFVFTTLLSLLTVSPLYAAELSTEVKAMLPRWCIPVRIVRAYSSTETALRGFSVFPRQLQHCSVLDYYEVAQLKGCNHNASSIAIFLGHTHLSTAALIDRMAAFVVSYHKWGNV